jgi:hypothetical protein
VKRYRVKVMKTVEVVYELEATSVEGAVVRVKNRAVEPLEVRPVETVNWHVEEIPEGKE